MGELTDKPEDIGLDSLKLSERDRIDLNHEMADDETGRIKRFLSDSTIGLYGETEKQKSERRYRTLLDMLLAEDPHYAALYKRVSDKLEKARQAVDQALIDANQRLEDSDRNLQIMREKAATQEDGTKVFQSTSDSSTYTEDGTRLSDDEAQNIVFSDDAPSWEEYTSEKEKHELSTRQKEEIETYQRDVLDPAAERMKDEDNPYTKDELDDLEERIDNEIPEAARNHYKMSIAAEKTQLSTTSAAHGIIAETQMDVPDIATAFDLAATDIPDLDPIPEFKHDPVPTVRTPG